MLRIILFVLMLEAALAAEAVQYSYDAAGRLILADYGGGKTISYSYDKAGNLLNRTVTAGGPSSEEAKAEPSKKTSSKRTAGKTAAPAKR